MDATNCKRHPDDHESTNEAQGTLEHTMTSGRSRSSVGKTSSISAIEPRQEIAYEREVSRRTLCVRYVLDRPSILHIFHNPPNEAFRALRNSVYRHKLVDWRHPAAVIMWPLAVTGRVRVADTQLERPGAHIPPATLTSGSHRARDGVSQLAEHFARNFSHATPGLVLDL